MAEETPQRAPLYVFLSVLLAIGYLVARMVAPYALALFVGAMLAALGQPVFKAARRLGMGPRLAAAAVTLGALLLVIVPAALFAVQAVRQGIAVAEVVSQREDITFEGVLQYLERLPPVRYLAQDSDGLRTQLVEAARRGAAVLTGALGRMAKGIPEFLLQLVLTVVALFFFLVDGKRFVDWMLERSALHPDVRSRLVQSLHGTAIATVWAGLAAAGVQALLVFLGFVILQIPAAFLAGGASFILAWIPMVGTLPVTLAGAAYLYSQEAMARLVGLLVLAVIVGLSDNLVRPLVLKGGEGMHPFVALLAILGGIEVFGIFGVFLGPVVAALFITLFDIWPALAERSGVKIRH